MWLLYEPLQIARDALSFIEQPFLSAVDSEIAKINSCLSEADQIGQIEVVNLEESHKPLKILVAFIYTFIFFWVLTLLAYSLSLIFYCVKG